MQIIKVNFIRFPVFSYSVDILRYLQIVNNFLLFLAFFLNFSNNPFMLLDFFKEYLTRMIHLGIKQEKHRGRKAYIS
jgi:hypothetical protein